MLARTFAVATISLLTIATHEPAQALVGIQCGAPINSVLRLEPVASSINSTVFVNLVNVNIAVPAGTTRCIKVVFTGEATCSGPSTVSDRCFIRALDNATELNPQGAGFQTLLSEDSTPN